MKFVNLNPKIALKGTYRETIKKLSKIIGKEKLALALDINKTFPSPLIKNKDSNWIKKAKIIGINPRIIGTYFNIVKYAMTFPEDTIHLMPLWEAGCDGSIYARVNWKLNDDWLDKELIEEGYRTAEEQLKLVINLLHALGKKVGFDLTGHTDKFSEEVFIEPECFEWIKLNEEKTAEENLEPYDLLKDCIINYLKKNGQEGTDEIYNKMTYEEREEILFGKSKEERTKRRIELMNYVRECGFETLPVTEHAPSRPIKFKEMVEGYAEFKVKNQNQSAKIFNSITPYRWYKSDEEGFLITDKPCKKTFDYFFNKVLEFQEKFNFDFFRGDMAHNQISHSNKNEIKDENFEFEMWKLLKDEIQKKTPYFASFAEAFFSKYYIDGFLDMKNKNFDVILGVSNFLFLDSKFIKFIKDCYKIKDEYGYVPCVASITNDSDQKQNNKFHKSPYANELRYFFQLFLMLPGYTGMGFELRNLNPEDDFEYSGIYTNWQKEGYRWGKNREMFCAVSRMRKLFAKIYDENFETTILKTNAEDCLVWIIHKDNIPLYLCAVNLNKEKGGADIHFEQNPDFNFENKKFVPVFSILGPACIKNTANAEDCVLKNINFKDAIVYKIKNNFFKKKKNKNQLLFVTTEFAPYAKSGGLADYSLEFTESIKKETGKDIRAVMPLYNAENSSLYGEKLFLKLTNGKEFPIEDTKIQTEFTFGINKSYAKLFKIKNSIIPIYLVYSPAFLTAKKEYEIDFVKFPAAFSAAVCSLLKEMKRKEKFNPEIIQTNDHLTSNIGLLIKDLKKCDKFYRGIKIVHTVHNITDTGTYGIMVLPLYFFSKNRLDLMLRDEEVSIVLNSIKEGDKLSALNYIKENQEYLNKTGDENYKLLKIIIAKKFLFLDEEYFNMTKNIINSCTRWITVSKNAYFNLTENVYENYAKDYFKINKKRGCGILSGIKKENFNPENGKEIKFPYNIENYKEGKEKNKIYLQENLSYLEEKVYGKISRNKNSTLLLYAGRSEKIKGFHIIEEIIPNILEEDENLQIIIAGKDVVKKNEKFFKSARIKKLYNNGQMAAIDGFIDIKQFYAAADLFLLPGLIETCGLAIMQAMKYGTPSVTNITGCVEEIITKENGFATLNPMFQNDNAAKIFKEALTFALETYKDEEAKDLIIKNAMKTNTDWNIQKYIEIYKEAGQ